MGYAGPKMHADSVCDLSAAGQLRDMHGVAGVAVRHSLAPQAK